MSSTDAKVRKFFDTRLVPAAERLRARQVELFPMRPDDDAATWYEAPHEMPEFVEVDPDELAETLRERWEAEGLPELAALAAPLMALRELEEVVEASADVSPFMYVMY